MTSKACKYCRNAFPEEDIERHEMNCAQNPDVQEKARKLGEIEPYVKTVILKDGKIERMYWAHSTGADDFDIKPLLVAWREIDPNADPHSVQFLQKRGFKVLMA